MSEQLALINDYLYNKYDKLVINTSGPKPILVHDINDKTINIISFMKKYSNDILGFTISNEITDLEKNFVVIHSLIDIDITKKEYYDKYITNLVKKVYENKTNELFINDLMIEIEKETKKFIKKPEEKKKRRKPITAAIKKQVWNINIGEEIGKSKCQCCKITDITQITFICGYIISDVNGGDNKVSNLKPICQKCNLKMGLKNMSEIMK